MFGKGRTTLRGSKPGLYGGFKTADKIKCDLLDYMIHTHTHVVTNYTTKTAHTVDDKITKLQQQ